MKTFGSLRFDPDTDKWIMDKVQPHVAIRLKANFNRIPKHQPSPFEFDNRPDTCQDLDWFVTRYPLEMSRDDKEILEVRKLFRLEQLSIMEEIMKPDYKPRDVITMKKPPRFYQLQSNEVYLTNRALLLGDVYGLGKTVSAITSFTSSCTLPAVVVVKTHLTRQWKAKIEEFTDLKVHIIKGTSPYSLPVADVYILKYSCLAGWVDTYVQGLFKSVVFDEIQQLRIPESQRYQAAQELVKNTEYALGLSATPIYNYGDETHSIMDLLKPGCLGTRGDFLREWGNGDRVITDPAALGAYLRENFLFIRRTRKDVGMELPEVNTFTHTVEYDEKAIEKIEEMAYQLSVKTMYGEFTERGQAGRELNMLVRKATGVSKAKSVAAYVRVLVEGGEPVLLAGWHRDVYDIWNEELKDLKPAMYTGSESDAAKYKSEQAFINGETDLLFISLRSGDGLDSLQKRCSVVVVGELDWSPKVHEQLIGRLDRDGQENPVTAIYLISDCGSDPLVVELLGLKNSQAAGITDPFATEITERAKDDSRIKLLAKRFLEKRKDKHVAQKNVPDEHKAPLSEGDDSHQSTLFGDGS